MSISKRLKTIIELVTVGDTIADIGTDHGYVPISLLRENKVRRAIAVDVSKGSLEKAYSNAIRAGICIEENDFTCQCEKTLAEEMKERLSAIKSGQIRKSDGIIAFRLSDGLSALRSGEADCLILSGMGGILMTEILSNHPDVTHAAKELILSPHRDAELVRMYVKEQGFFIEYDEELLDKKKRYVILKAVQPSTSGANSSSGTYSS